MRLIELKDAKDALSQAEIDANWDRLRFDAEYASDRLESAKPYFTREELQIIYFALVDIANCFSENSDKISAINSVKEKVSALLK